MGNLVMPVDGLKRGASVRPDLSVVIPVYRGADRLERLIPRLLPVADRLNAEIILVDDASDDRTWEMMNRLANTSVPVSLVRLGRQSGQQVATLAGCLVARGALVATMDDDLEHRPEDLPRLADAARDTDLVYAIPTSRRYGLHRKLGSRCFDLVFTLAIGKPEGLRLTGFRVIKRWVIDRMLTAPVRTVYLSALALAQKPRIATVPVEPGELSPSRQRFLRLARLTLGVALQYNPVGRRLIRLPTPISERLPIAEVIPWNPAEVNQ